MVEDKNWKRFFW